MSTDEYVPSEDDVRQPYVDYWVEGEPGRSAEFDRFLVRVRRAAAREALDQAEARIKAVRDVLDSPHMDEYGDAVIHVDAIRRALDGDA